MVQFFLSRSRRTLLLTASVACAVAFLLTPAWASLRSKDKDKGQSSAAAPPDLLLEGGRKLSYERSFHSEREVRPQRGFWRRTLDVIAGEPDFHTLVRPYGIVTDSRGRIIVTDPGSAGVHIFDFARQKYKFISRSGKRKDSMVAPQCVAVDEQRQHLCHRFRRRESFCL